MRIDRPLFAVVLYASIGMIGTRPTRTFAAEDEEPAPPSLSERVTVTASRLPDKDASRDDVPASVTVITRDQIARSGARTLQELLSSEAGVILFDEIGNGVEQTFGLRGFTSGSGMAVYIDGARINDPRNNTVPLALIPIDAVERVEIMRGSGAALAGGGSEAGVVHILTRQGTSSRASLEGEVGAGGGSYDSTRIHAALTARAGRFGAFASASRDDTNGFRSNSEVGQNRYAATSGLDLGGDRRLWVTLIASDASLGAPGALTETELKFDPSLAPFNLEDGSEQRLRLASMNFRGPLGGGLSLAANVNVRNQESESLSTGRSAPLFGGFFLDSDTTSPGATIQLSHRFQGGGTENTFVLGTEWLRGSIDAAGFFTPSDDLTHVDRSNPASRNTVERRTRAIFVQESWRPQRRWNLSSGVRFDTERIGYEESVPDPENRDSKSFSEMSMRAGAGWNPAERFGFYVSYSESFLPPTAEELFSFPLFGSNPSLEPERTRTAEAGFRGRWISVRSEEELDLALFEAGTTNEIIFDPDSPLGLFGANVNAGETRRRGLEASFRARLGARLNGYVNLSVTEAVFRNGENRGKTVPLVPRERVCAGLAVDFPGGFALRPDAIYSGDQVLDNDDANAQPRLASYTVVNLRASWNRPPRETPSSVPSAGEAGNGVRGVTLFIEARNLFDREYATRGIFAFDSASSTSMPFFTPAPGRRYLAGAEWRF